MNKDASDKITVEDIHREWTESRYIGPYPRQHTDIAPFIASFTALMDLMYYWALKTGRMNLESFMVQFMVAGLFFMTAYSAGFLGVWWGEKQRQNKVEVKKKQ